MIRVYQFGLRPPTTNVDLVRAEMRAAHEYRNDLVAIERGRRHVVRALHDTPEVRDAEALVQAATKSMRKDAVAVLIAARKAARDAAVDELARIAEIDTSIRRDARALCKCYWGSYLTIEAAADQVRKMPLWDKDLITPNDPKFQRWTGESQIGVQLQREIRTPEVFDGCSTFVRLVLAPDTVGRKRYTRFGSLSLRIGSWGRDPIWATWPIKLHRAIPDAARWRWVRVSCRQDGPFERWTCEITLDIPGENARVLDTSLKGAIAVELEWGEPNEGDVIVAAWLDDNGDHGAIHVPRRVTNALRKAASIRSVRDTLLNDLRPRLARAIKECAESLPRWLQIATNTLHLWKQQSRFHDLTQRWRRERCDAARPAYEMLDAWEMRDRHLWEYEGCSRRQALRCRLDTYRVLAAQWSRKYKTVVLPDRDLSIAARRDDDSDLRFIAAPSELAGALKHAFDSDTVESPWKEEISENDDRTWAERTIERWRGGQITGTARKARKPGGAWAERKAKRVERVERTEGVRNPDLKPTE